MRGRMKGRRWAAGLLVLAVTLGAAATTAVTASAETDNQRSARLFGESIYKKCRDGGGSVTLCTNRKNRAELALTRFLQCMDDAAAMGVAPDCGVDPRAYGDPKRWDSYPPGTAPPGGLPGNYPGSTDPTEETWMEPGDSPAAHGWTYEGYKWEYHPTYWRGSGWWCLVVDDPCSGGSSGVAGGAC